MFKLVKVKENSLVLVYKIKKSGELVYFGATRTEKPKRVPVLWGYTYTVFDSTPLDVGIDITVEFADGAAIVDYAATVEVSEWFAENAIKNIKGVDREGIVELARGKIGLAVTEIARESTRAEFMKNRSDNAFRILKAANALLGEVGMIMLAFRLNSADARDI